MRAKPELKQRQDVLQVAEILLCNEFSPPCAGLFLLKVCWVFSQHYSPEMLQRSQEFHTGNSFLHRDF